MLTYKAVVRCETKKLSESFAEISVFCFAPAHILNRNEKVLTTRKVLQLFKTHM